ncbi:MAG: hypothetical protein KME59_16055 [Trichormus sp. ATA11-4-KO1]|nr:hypothetical protein [Trichormus sp. ATA11-4-KO1]
MTSRANEIQKLIADIDNLLNSSGKRLSRLLSSQAPEPREVLERIRNFLLQLEESEVLKSDDHKYLSGQAQRSPLLVKFVKQGNDSSPTQHNQLDQEQSNFLSQQLKSELSVLIQPLQAELAAMMQERATLVQEIRQLEQRRLHNYSLSQQWANQEQIIADFLQVLMSRLVPNLTPHIAQNVANSSTASSVSNYSNMELASSTTQPVWESSAQAERLTHLARELDQRLLSLDGTVNVVFEALQRNINTYHESLCQSLTRMHSTGVQGEQLMMNFLNNLTQQLQQQSPNTLASFLGVEKNELLTSSSLLSTTANTVTPSSEMASQSGEFIEPEPSSALTFNDEDENVAVTDDLDAMLLELGIDELLSLDATVSELQPDNLELISDEVDQIYASLLGTDNFTNSSLDVIPEELSSSSNIADTTPASLTQPVEPGVVTEELSSSSNIADTTPASPTQPVEQLPDPWFEQTNADFLGLSNTNLQQTPDNPLKPQDSSSELWQELFFEEDTKSGKSLLSGVSQAEIVAIDNFLIQPSNADTITALSDLFAEISDEEQWLGVSTVSETTVVTPSMTTVTHTPEVVVNDDEQEKLVDKYIPASPQENLLSPEENQSANVPDISLDEVQWQQLNQDLANFDELLEPDFNWDIFAGLEDGIDQQSLTDPSMPNLAFSSLEISQVAPISWPQTEADLDFSPTTEKKTEVTTSGQDISLVSSSSPVNNLETTFNILDSVWYLGIDVGTTGISAALLNRSISVVYPIYWSAENQQEVTSFQQSFRLPAEVYLPSASVPQGETEGKETEPHELTKSGNNPKNNFYSAQLKPYLQVAIPYKSAQQKWEPVLQFNEFSAGPLIWVVRSLSKLLLTLKSDRHSTTQGLIAAAVGLNEKNFHSIINNITGVICTCPASWSEQYRFNVREALLTSKLVQHPQQVFFVEEAIASLLSTLDSANGETVQLSENQGLRPAKTSDQPLEGNTFVMNIGATATEMALVDLPNNLLQLNHNDFMLHSFAYASKGIEQDIICQLLLPTKYRQTRLENQGESKTITSNPWQWQPAFPGLDQMHWQSLALEELELPRVGEPDITARIRLQQRLESSLLGQAVLDAALALKLILQHQDSFTLDLADQRWVLQRRDLENQVFVPFVRRLNRELNKLLVARGIPTEAINQVLLTGGVASLEVVHNWLRQKLPNAKIIQDLYLGDNGAPNCSRVAYGLAMLPLYPQVLEEPRQQYTDYFLFTELLGLLPDRTLSFSDILQLFEERGINTSICQQRLLAFLEGELPPGLIPVTPDATWLAQSSQENSDYQAIAAAPLFAKQGNLTYRPNFPQLLVLRRYLDAIKASTQQPMEEPYTVNFDSLV